MADNVNLTAGDGTIIAGADVIGGVAYPRTKLVWGPDNTVNDADVASGKPIPVQLRGSDGTDRSNALPVTLTSTTITGTAAVTQSGTWTVQPGNTANTTAWKVDGSAVTQPISATALTNINTALGSTALDLGTGTGGSRTLRMAIDTSQVPTAGQTTMSGSVPVAIASDQSSVKTINGGSSYETVAASQTNQAMGATGAAGDYLSHVIVSPATAGCGVVTVLDNATAVVSFPGGGTTALSNLIPFVIPIGIVSTSGAWKITTGANVSAVGVGRFT